MLMDEAALDIVGTVAGMKRFPARKEVFGGLVSHFVVLWISITYLLPHGHLMSEKMEPKLKIKFHR